MNKKFLIIAVIFSLFISQKAFADNIIPVNSINKPVINAGEFSKTYKTSSENLMYLLLSAINDCNYMIEEIQFKTGSVLFKAYSKEFIASVASQDGYNSFIKILPSDNVYNFSPALIQKLQTYIENNNQTLFKKIL